MAYQPLAGQNRAGEPIISHDPASIGDLIVIEVVDTRQPDYAPLAYGTAYPGYVDPGTGATLYTDYVLADIEAIDNQFSRRIYQKFPGSWLVSEQPNEDTGDVWVISKRKNIGDSITPAESLVPTYDPGEWLPLHVYVAGNVVRPVAGNATFKLVCATGGTSGAVEPTWNATIDGATPADGSCGWITLPNVSLVSTARAAINTYIAWEVVTNIPTSSARSKATAIKGSQSIAFRFFDRPDLALYALGFKDIVAFQTKSAELIQATTYTFQVLSATKPGPFAEDIILSSFIGWDGAYTRHEGCLTDGQEVISWGTPITIPTLAASQPTLTAYNSSWVGVSKIIKESVKSPKFGKLWEVVLTEIVMR